MVKTYGEIARDLMQQRHQSNMLLHHRGGKDCTATNHITDCTSGTYTIPEQPNHALLGDTSNLTDIALANHQAFCLNTPANNTGNNFGNTNTTGGKYKPTKRKYRKTKKKTKRKYKKTYRKQKNYRKHKSYRKHKR